MNLYIIRHAQSLGNISQQQTPNDGLSPLGYKQAERLLLFFRETALTHIFCSPFTRVIETASPTAVQAGLQIQLVPELSEIFDAESQRDFSWEPCDALEERFPIASFITRHDRGMNWWPNWPERLEFEVKARVRRFYECELVPMFGTEAAIAVFGHGATTYHVKKLIHPLKPGDQNGNAIIHAYTIDPSGICLDYQIHDSHLREVSEGNFD